MKLYGERIGVRVGQNNLPTTVRWRLSIYRVRSIEEQWLYAGRWWATPGLQGRRRHYYRVSCTAPHGFSIGLEIYRDGGAWMLSRVLD